MTPLQISHRGLYPLRFATLPLSYSTKYIRYSVMLEKSLTGSLAPRSMLPMRHRLGEGGVRCSQGLRAAEPSLPCCSASQDLHCSASSQVARPPTLPSPPQNGMDAASPRYSSISSPRTFRMVSILAVPASGSFSFRV